MKYRQKFKEIMSKKPKPCRAFQESLKYLRKKRKSPRSKNRKFIQTAGYQDVLRKQKICEDAEDR